MTGDVQIVAVSYGVRRNDPTFLVCDLHKILSGEATPTPLALVERREADQQEAGRQIGLVSIPPVDLLRAKIQQFPDALWQATAIFFFTGALSRRSIWAKVGASRVTEVALGLFVTARVEQFLLFADTCETSEWRDELGDVVNHLIEVLNLPKAA